MLDRIPSFGPAQRVIESLVIAVVTSTGLFLVGSVYIEAYYSRMSIDATSLDLAPPYIALQAAHVVQSLIEAMSAGTPVIAWRNGSVPEVIKDGVSGVVVDSMEEAIAAVETCKAMSREGVRRYFETRFTASVMARSYVAAYESLLAGDMDAIKIPGLTIGAPATLNGAANGATVRPVLRAV